MVFRNLFYKQMLFVANLLNKRDGHGPEFPGPDRTGLLGVESGPDRTLTDRTGPLRTGPDPYGPDRTLTDRTLTDFIFGLLRTLRTTF